MLVNKEYLLKVKPKVLALHAATAKERKLYAPNAAFCLVLEQRPDGNYVDQCYLTETEFFEIVQAGFGRTEAVTDTLREIERLSGIAEIKFGASDIYYQIRDLARSLLKGSLS